MTLEREARAGSWRVKAGNPILPALRNHQRHLSRAMSQVGLHSGAISLSTRW